MTADGGKKACGITPDGRANAIKILISMTAWYKEDGTFKIIKTPCPDFYYPG